MKKQVLLAVWVIGIMFGLAGAPAQAQDGKVSLFGGYSYGTNNFGCNSDFNCSPTGLHGYNASVTYNFNKHIGLEGNFSGHNGSSTTYSTPVTTTSNGYSEVISQDLYSYTFGPKLSLPVGNFSLFTHFLVGAAHVRVGDTYTCISSGGGTCSKNVYNVHGNGMAFKTGGGVDWNHGRWGVRILEVDYLRDQISANETASCSNYTCTSPSSFTASANNFELSTGVIFHFGKK
jgi:Outer membrane protein beta-barrel domain